MENLVTTRIWEAWKKLLFMPDKAASLPESRAATCMLPLLGTHLLSTLRWVHNTKAPNTINVGLFP